MTFSKIKQILDDKKILILGYGMEGRSTLSFIKDYVSSASITVADKNDVSASLPEGVRCVSGSSYMSGLTEYDVIIKSPGIVFVDQEKDVIDRTTSQTDLFLKEFAHCTVGITGTKGKSTTTTLIHHIMKTAGIDAVLTGNVGIPPLDSARCMKEDSVAVFEMSCHQLEFQKLSPHVAVILNLYEDHLDHYGTREMYVKAKENIYLYQTKNDVLVIDSRCEEQINKAVSRVISVGGDSSDYRYTDGRVGDCVIPIDEISLIGEHNYYNISVAKAVTDIFGVNDADFVNSLKTYRPLPHRLEYFATKNGVDYYDDSISTVCQTTIQAILSLKNVETVIIGGMDRGIDYTELVEFFKGRPIKNIILAYDSGKRISKMLDEVGVGYILADDLEDSVRIASKVTKRGGKCVLSPAAASYGYFKNFEERGETFKKLVREL